MPKALYIVLTGSKQSIEENKEKIEQFLSTIKRKVGNKEIRAATIQYEVPIDNEHFAGNQYQLKEFPKIESYLKGYRAVVLKYSHYGKRVRVYLRGRRWRINKKGKTLYIPQKKKDGG